MAPVQWYGGKGHLARRIVPLLPSGRVYVEPYCGAASVFWHLPRPYPVEVLNDLDERIVNLFRVLQDRETFRRFARMVIWTPYSLAELRRALALQDDPDPVLRAWAFYVLCNQAVSGRPAKTEGNWSRTFVAMRGMAGTASKWRGRMRLLQRWHDRLTRVQIDCRDALEVIAYWDSPDTVFYVDPPYVPDTRKDKRVYAAEADLEHHERLVSVLLNIQGQAVLSGYEHEVYRPLEEAGWEVIRWQTASYAAGRNRNSPLRGAGAALAHVPRREAVWVKRHMRQEMLPIASGCVL